MKRPIAFVLYFGTLPLLILQSSVSLYSIWLLLLILPTVCTCSKRQVIFTRTHPQMSWCATGDHWSIAEKNGSVVCEHILLHHRSWSRVYCVMSSIGLLFWIFCLTKLPVIVVRHSTTISYPPIENSFNGYQGHPLVCLPPWTAQRQLDPEVKRFEHAAIYSANTCRQL